MSIYKSDIGTDIILAIRDENLQPLDVSGATTKQIKLEKPDGVVSAKTATFYDDGTDGRIQYTTTTGDLDTVGTWKAQGYLVLDTGETFHTSIAEFTVEDFVA